MGLALNKNQIPTDTERFETNIRASTRSATSPPIPAKRSSSIGLPRSGTGAFAIKARLNPDEKVHLQYTTTSPIMHKRLGVADTAAK